MKKILIGLSVVSAFLMTSCEDDTSDIVMNITNNTTNNGGGGGGDPTVTEVEIGGTYTEDLSLDGDAENVTYILSEPLVMEEGTTLNIAAGTKVYSSAGTNGYIAIKQGAKINADGDDCNPIILSSNANNPEPSDWGGLVILGKAIINSGTSSTSEVGGFAYGGDDASDNSGVIRNVRVEYTGASIDDQSEFNGFSMYAVGSGTIVENIESYEGADDGIEFFGGSVNVDNLIVTNAQDDSMDWTEGWNGTVNNVYIKMNDQGDHAIEADSNSSDNAAQPFSDPTITNITMIGAYSGQEAVRFRRGTKADLNNVWVEGFSEGFDIDDAQTVQNVADDELNVRNVTFVDVDNQLVAEGVDANEFFSGLGNGAMTDVNTWGDCWSTVGGNTSGRTIELAGNYSSDYTLNPANTYKLSGAMVIEDGATLNIPQGMTIKCAAGGTQVYVAVLQGGKINAQGSSDNPIIFTSNASNPAPGDWGGLLLLGKATLNAGTSSTSEVGGFPYGGGDDADNSGTISYMRVEFTGASIDDQSEFNGFSMYGVGNGTTIEYIQAHEGADDGIEFFGGTVNVSNLVVTNAGDDSVDWTEGFRGTLDNVYIVQNETSDKAIEADGNSSDNSATPYSSVTINNLTAYGAGTNEAFKFRRGTQININGAFVKDYTKGANVDDAVTVDWIQTDVSNITDITFDNVATILDSEEGSNGAVATEAEFFSGLGNGQALDISAWSTWTTGL